MYIHANGRRKKRSGSDIKSKYRLELQNVNSAELGSVVAKEFGQVLQWAGVETVIVNNDKKAHSKTVTDPWTKFDIKVWPGVRKVKDQTLVADFTGETAEKLGGFPVNSPDFTVQDQSVNTLGRILWVVFTTHSTSKSLLDKQWADFIAT